MDAAFTEEQHTIRRTLRTLLDKRCGPDEVKAAVRTPPGYDEELWRELAGRLHLPGLALPAVYGGAGRGPTELALACAETGRTVLPSPLIATAALAAPLILALGSERQRAGLLPALASGELTGTLAVPGGRLPTALALTGPNDGDWAGGGRAGGIQAHKEEGGTGWRLYGEAGQVLNGHTAEVLVVAAHTGGFARSSTRLFLVRADGAAGAVGLRRTRQAVMDETRPQARLELRDVPAELLGEEGGRTASAVGPALAATGVAAAAALAVEAVGAAGAALAGTAAYVGERERFGRPVGSCQAVRRRLADLYVTLQAARSAAYHAAWTAGRGPLAADGSSGAYGSGPGPTGRAGERGTAVLALAQALEALRAVAAEAVQLPGGIGFGWERAAQLYFTRAAGDELLLGPAHRLRARAVEEAGLFAGAGRGAGRTAGLPAGVDA
ncbi:MULTISPECIES: acyl-CoA dehydrogenase family protein [Streptomyces]|uniref:Acyl-CoA/acyl-ACP dehydrogenase n=1 Tax=Streptomyces siderophoricus TaxID=2802281 RepID=A0ABS1MR13_9ACTN|nr:acyl-CoA dehydrogenase family protein [Streptomyces sp. 9-7]MBL1090194.1 acyl-CoA/acyl-ACP dehydrogenase [Streptomyces sp. 9-7]